MTRQTRTLWETTLALKFPPLAVFYANEIPPNARPLVGRCAALALAQAARGETVYVDLENCRCPGAVGGLALGPFASERFPCGAAGFERFFSTGFAGWPPGDETLAQMEPAALRKFEKGEGYAPTPDAAKRYVASLPTVEPEGVCVVFKPLAKLTSNETPKAVGRRGRLERARRFGELRSRRFDRRGSDSVRFRLRERRAFSVR